MVGFELDGEIDHAQEVVDEILHVFPASVRHHQKRVEYAVRARDRERLIHAYLELADALFRTGAGDKAVSVYGRVLELDGSNSRAEFALVTLAPDELSRLRGAPSRPERWSDELGAISGNRAGARADAPADADEAPAPSVQSLAPEPESVTDAWVPTATGHDDAPAAADSEDAVGPGYDRSDEAPDEPADTEAVTEPDGTRAPERREESHPDVESAAVAPAEPVVAAAPDEIPPGPPAARSRAGDDDESLPRIERARRLTPVGTADSEFVDLGEWLRMTEPTKSTRMLVEDPKPTGDEQADFDELLRRFKRGVAENVEAEDYEAHYDLGVAFKEMGLVDEAIAQFQKALRGTTHKVRSYESLGQCFVEKAQYPIAAALLQRATEVPGIDDQQLVGVLYLLGFATEHLGRSEEALRYYLRVFAVDIEFRDIASRVASMEHLTN